MPIQVILLDLGNVLLDYDPRTRLDLLATHSGIAAAAAPTPAAAAVACDAARLNRRKASAGLASKASGKTRVVNTPPPSATMASSRPRPYKTTNPSHSPIASPAPAEGLRANSQSESLGQQDNQRLGLPANFRFRLFVGIDHAFSVV